MAETFEQIRERMQRELDETGRLDTPRWLREHPAFAREIKAFALDGIDDSPDGEWSEAEERAWDEVMGEGIRYALRNAKIRSAEIRTGQRIAALPPAPARMEGESNLKYARALIMAWVVARLYAGDPWLSRVKIQKSLYLLEAALHPGVFTEFEVTAFGLYDEQLRFADDDAEDRGTRSGWIIIDPAPASRERPDLFLPGPSAAVAVERARDYLRDPDLAGDFIDLLIPHSEWVLSAWQTVHKVVHDLVGNGAATVDVDSVKAGILAEEPWQTTKLPWQEFSDEAIEDALGRLERLRLIPENIVDYH
jgi:hypothetical protein